MGKNHAEEITNKFIEALNNNNIPWVKPWVDWLSWSRLSGNDYQGINSMILDSGEYATFKQIKDAGGRVNKGAKGKRIVYYGTSAKTIEHEDGETEEKLCKFLKSYVVFNINDTDLEQKYNKQQKKNEFEEIEAIDNAIEEYKISHNITIEHGGNKAYNADILVKLPEKEQFLNKYEYYSTLLHELIHSTAAYVGRDLSRYRKDKKERAREELVAEIGSAYIMSYLGFEDKLTFKNSTSYVNSWAKYLGSDRNAILYAVPKAIEAANLILNIA